MENTLLDECDGCDSNETIGVYLNPTYITDDFIFSSISIPVDDTFYHYPYLLICLSNDVTPWMIKHGFGDFVVSSTYMESYADLNKKITIEACCSEEGYCDEGGSDILTYRVKIYNTDEEFADSLMNELYTTLVNKYDHQDLKEMSMRLQCLEVEIKNKATRRISHE